MENPLNKLIKKHPALRFLSNRYALALIVFVIWMLFLDNHSYLDHRELNKEIEELENNKEYFQNEIDKDKKSINLLKNPHQIEKYAREKYFMKKDSEDIYIIEFEDEKLKEKETDSI